MKRPIPVTHVSLQSYASGLGLNPLHFEGAYANDLFQNVSGCDSVWKRHSWQSPNSVSHEDLANQIRDAEKTIGQFLGYNIAPDWSVLELRYPQRKAGLSYMRDINHIYRTLQLQKGYIIAGGRRGAEYIDTFTIVYEDRDGDGFAETAVIDTGQELNWQEVAVFYTGTNADEKWRIRPIRDIETYALIMDSWLFIDPDEKSKIPTNSLEPISITGGTNLVPDVDVYRIYNNQDLPSCEFIWDISGTTQDGYLEVLDHDAGIVRPLPATYLYAANCATAIPTSFCLSDEPDRVRVYVYSGKISDEWLNGYTLDPIDTYIAESVRLLATARLDRDLCGCNVTIDYGRQLREDMALVSPQGNFLAVADVIQECPFGTRRGEWLAWNRLRYENDRYFSVALV